MEPFYERPPSTPNIPASQSSLSWELPSRKRSSRSKDWPSSISSCFPITKGCTISLLLLQKEGGVGLGQIEELHSPCRLGGLTKLTIPGLPVLGQYLSKTILAREPESQHNSCFGGHVELMIFTRIQVISRNCMVTTVSSRGCMQKQRLITGENSKLLSLGRTKKVCFLFLVVIPHCNLLPILYSLGPSSN